MLRRTARCNVHLLQALLPTTTVRLPTALLEPNQVDLALKTIADIEPIAKLTNVAPLGQAISLLTTPDAHREAQKLFKQCSEAYRTDLEVGGRRSAIHRLQLHEALMTSGYYMRACDRYGDPLDSVRFVVNHFNFDVRRDVAITTLVHQTLLEHLPTTAESDQMLSDLLLMERRLYGANRLRAITGKQWLCLGCPLREITTEAELDRIMSLAPVKQHGNFSVSWEDKEGRWKEATVRCLPEPEDAATPIEAAILHPNTTASGINWSTVKPVATMHEWSLRALKPAPPLPWGEYIREKLLQIWVYWFSFWAIFFLVDEEVITLIGLIWGKWQHSKVMAQEAEKTGRRVYMNNYRFY